MVSARVRLTYEDYVELPDDRRYEIIDGELYEMTAPTLRHQGILANLIAHTLPGNPGERCIRADLRLY